MPERPNYYFLLELDPSVDDWAVIEKQILDKKRQWGSEKAMGNPAARRKAEHNVSIIRDIEETLKNPETRRQEAKEARRQQDTMRQIKLAELKSQLAVLKAEKHCTKEQFDKLVKNSGGFLSAKEIENLLRQTGIPVAETPGQGEEEEGVVREFIDPVTASNIKRNLLHLKIANLYELLGLNRRSSPKSLHDRADEINREILRIGRTDPDSNARKELCGICLALFRDEKEKQKYDNTLSVEDMETMIPQMELAGTDGFIMVGELDELVKQAMEKGIQKEDAISFIKTYAKKRRWRVQTTGQLNYESLRQCRYCFTLIGLQSATNCPNCSESLSQACPQCGTNIPMQDNACSECGCYPGDVSVVKALFKEAQHLALDGGLADALDRLNRALIYWPKWQTALDKKQRIEQEQKKRETEFRLLEDLTNSNKMLEARSALDRFVRAYGEHGIENLKKRIYDSVAKAEAAFREAEQVRRSGRAEEAIEKYEEALSFSSDFEPARQAMASCPPPAPIDLQVTIINNGLRLTWREVKARGSVSYKVIRKAHGLPNDSTDGERVGEAQTSRTDDIGVESGIPWHYAVYTLRGGITSRTSANSGPHLVTTDVKKLVVRGGDREVILNWEGPRGRKRIEVWRKNDGVPVRPGDGVQIVVSGDSAHDTGLVNGTNYGYLVVAIFDDPKNLGKEIYTSGIRSSAFPIAPPKPVTDLTCVRQGKAVLLNWTPIAGASVQIRQAIEHPNSHLGLIIPLDQADRFGTLIAASSTGSAQSTITVQGRICFVPLTVAAGIAVVGNVATLTTIEDVMSLKAQAVGRDIVLSWEWPAGIDEAIVCFAYDRYPTDPINSHSTRARITRQEYDRNNCWELRGAARQPHYFTVFAKASNSDVYSAGAKTFESMGQSVSVSYRIVLKKAFLSRSVQEAWLELQCGDRASLQGLLVIGKQRNVPLSPADGTFIAEVPALYFRDGKAQIQIPQQYLNTPTYVKVFFRDPSNAQEIRLLPAPKEELRLG